MGKNSDKRKQRKMLEETSAFLPAKAMMIEATVTSSTSTTTLSTLKLEPAPAWWAQRLLPPPVEVPDDDDGTLARALFQVTSLLGTAMSRPDVALPVHMQKIAAAVARIVDADTVSLLRLEPGDGDLVPSRLVMTASHGLNVVDVGVVTFDVGDGIAGHVACTGDVVRVDDAPRDPRFSKLYGQRTEIGSLVAVPLRADKKILGVMTASRREIRAFSEVDEQRLLLTATTIAQDLEQSRLYREAVACPLTGLMSRVALLHHLPREVEIARRYQSQLSLVVLDVDGLSAFNAAHGRAAGDRFLRETAARLAKTVRAADLVARLGGDELCVLLPMTPANQARATAKRLSRVLTTPPIEPGCTWSMAVATLQSHVDEDATGLLARADKALVEAKAGGGDAIVSAVVGPR
jgi:diguanylate cyclase (GGDEF)-like protein